MASIDGSRTGTRNRGKSGMRNQSSIADLIVKGAIALVTAAFFIGAYLQFRVSFWLALIAALSIYITLLMLHALMRRSERVDALVSEVTRLEGEISRLKPQEETPPARGRQRSAAAARPPAPPPQAPGGSTFDIKSTPPFERPPAHQGRGVAPAGAPPPVPSAPSAPSAPAAVAQPPEPPPVLSPWPDASGASDSSMHDYWAFRPTKPTLPETSQGRRKDAPPTDAEREADLDAVQGMIKRLADEVSLGADASTSAPSQESIARASVEALNTTAHTMRAAAASKTPAAPAARERNAPPAMPPPIAPAHARLSSLAAALAAGRVDVFVDPIVGLADHHVHHYEATVFPRDERGVALPIAAHDRQLVRTGLLPLLDGARLKHAAQVCRSFAHERQKYCVLAAASGESLATDRFLDELANAYREREALAGELVLTFTQADVRAFGGTEWSSLTDMRDLGFRFGLDEVTDLNYEFTALRAAGFAFIKIDAQALMQGLPASGAVVPATDVCRFFSELGLMVIAVRLDSEMTRTKVVASGVSLGEGPLFGPPQMLAADGLAGPGIAAA